MLETILSLYITLMSVIFAGVANMAFCKYPTYQRLNIPMDAGRILSDGKRLFGQNKTWKGFIGMILFGGLSQIVWGLILKTIPSLESLNLFYDVYANSILTNLWIGLLLGLAYIVFELPNSFMKRRLEIMPGKPANNQWKWFFIFIDQADSLLGCALIVAVLVPISWTQFFGFIILGAGTHIVINQLLYFLKLRKNPF